MSIDQTDGALSSGRNLATLTGRGLLPASLSNASGIQKLDFVLGQANPPAFVAALATEELYLLMQDIGKTDAYVLIEYATADQLQGMLDLDIWHKDEIQLDRWLGWMDMALTVGFDTALKLTKATDDELIEYLFLADVTVHGGDLDLDAVPDELSVITSPDGLYQVTVPREHDLAGRLPKLMKLLWADDPERIRNILQQARFDLGSSVAEYLRHFRAGRLQDMGFDAPDEAAGVYSTLNIVNLRNNIRAELEAFPPIKPFGQGTVIEDYALRQVRPPELLASCLEHLDQEGRERFAQAFTYLVNKVFLSNTGDLSQTDDLPLAGRHAAALVNLGLAYLADENDAVGARILERIWPETLFKVGHTLTVELGVRARRLRLRAGASSGYALFGSPTDEALHGVALPHALYFRGLDERAAIDYRPFQTLADLARAEVRIADAERAMGFFETELGFTIDALDGIANISADARERIQLSTLFRTGLAQLMLGDEMRFAPLERDEVAAFARVAFDAEGAVSAGLRGALNKLGASVGDDLQRTFNAWIADMADAIGPVASRNIDLRFVGDLLLVSAAPE